MSAPAPPQKTQTKKPSLEQLLRRPDIWRGDSHAFTQAPSVDTGYPELNQALLHRGWPKAKLIEVCQASYCGEWWLFHHAINMMISRESSSYIALLAPPAHPFIAGLHQLGIAHEQLLIIEVRSANEFIGSFSELCRANICPIILAWQNNFQLPYAQLRKLQLNSTNNDGLQVIFRSQHAIEHSSPASLRLYAHVISNSLHLHIVKQRGKLSHTRVQLAMPHPWQTLASQQTQEQPEAYSTSSKVLGSFRPEKTSTSTIHHLPGMYPGV